ncbi:MAG: hypothetical protein ACR2NE_06005 [Pirellulales bacterium]
MLVRMHKKVCKKTGRTEEAGVFKQLHQKFAWFDKTGAKKEPPRLVDTDTGVVANSFAVDRAQPVAQAAAPSPLSLLLMLAAVVANA